MKYLFNSKKDDQRGFRSLRLISMTLSLTVLVVACELTVLGQVGNSVASEQVVSEGDAGKRQAYYLREAERASKVSDFIAVSVQAAQAILAKEKVSVKRTKKAILRLDSAYEKAKKQFDSEMACVGSQLIATRNVDQQVSLRKKQVDLLSRYHVMHQLLASLPPECGFDVTVEVESLYVELAVSRELLIIAEQRSADWHIDMAIEKLLNKADKRSARSAIYHHLTKAKHYASPGQMSMTRGVAHWKASLTPVACREPGSIGRLANGKAAIADIHRSISDYKAVSKTVFALSSQVSKLILNCYVDLEMKVKRLCGQQRSSDKPLKKKS